MILFLLRKFNTCFKIIRIECNIISIIYTIGIHNLTGGLNMIDTEYKIKKLQSCLGEKKLKQLGLIPCSTCREILTQVMNISLPEDLEDKAFLTSEEMSNISQSILLATHGFLKDTPQEILPEANADISSISKISIEAETVSEVEENHSSVTSSNTIDANNKSSASIHNISPELIESINNQPIKNEQDLVSKLLAILNQSHHIIQDNVGMGYIYTPPSLSPVANTLSCSECGHLYTIITYPSLKLMPLPVYLTDTEYEMIKGIYVDILL